MVFNNCPLIIQNVLILTSILVMLQPYADVYYAHILLYTCIISVCIYSAMLETVTWKGHGIKLLFVLFKNKITDNEMVQQIKTCLSSGKPMREKRELTPTRDPLTFILVHAQNTRLVLVPQTQQLWIEQILVLRGSICVLIVTLNCSMLLKPKIRISLEKLHPQNNLNSDMGEI